MVLKKENHIVLVVNEHLLHYLLFLGVEKSGVLYLV